MDSRDGGGEWNTQGEQRRMRQGGKGSGGGSDESDSDESGRGPTGRDQRGLRPPISDDEENHIDNPPFISQAGTVRSGVNPRYLLPANTQRPTRSPTTALHERAEPELDAYADSTRQWVAEVFKQDLAVHVDDLPVLNRNIKVSTPAAYAGEDDVESFSEWVINISRFFRMTRLVGRTLDQERIIVLGDLLSKQALQWYNSEVRAPERKRKRWTLLDVVYALQERFVHKATAQLASERYERVRFSAATGVAGLSNEIMKHADRMVQPPDAYSLRKKFMGALPPNIATHLILVYKLTAENATYASLLKGAIEVENGNRAMDLYRRTHENTARSERASGSKSTEQPRPRDTQRARQRTESRTDTPVSRDKDRRAVPSRSQRQMTPGNNHASSYPRPSAPRAAADESNIECWDCEKLGHKAGSPLCQHPKQRSSMWRMEETAESPAQRHTIPTDEDDGPVGGPIEVNDGGRTLEGNQYEGDYLAEGYDEYQHSEVSDHETGSHLEFHMMQADHDGTDDEDAYWAAVEALDLSALTLAPASDADLLAESERGAVVPRNFEADLQLEHARLNQVVSYIHQLASVVERQADDTVHLTFPINPLPDRPPILQTAAIRPPVSCPLALTMAAERFTRLVQRLLERVYDQQSVLRRIQADVLSEHVSRASLRTRVQQALGEEHARQARWAAHVCLREDDPHEYGSPATYTDATVDEEAWDGTGIALGTPQHFGMTPVVDDRPLVYEPAYLRAMAGGGAQRASMRVTGASRPRPAQPSHCVTISGSLKDLHAKILIDTGSSINAVSPAFAALSQIEVFPLDDPIGLQLGCVGSRSKINFGCQTTLTIEGRTFPTYLDIVNLDHYDVVLGIPFLTAHAAEIRFQPRGLVLGGRAVAVLGGEGVHGGSKQESKVFRHTKSTTSHPSASHARMTPGASQGHTW